jgi:DNA-binding transcriptional MerR regulator
MEMESLSIGDLARRSSCNVQTVRYYEQVGLMPTPVRTSGRQRRYDGKAAERLDFIRRARDLGFSVEAIRALLQLADRPEESCEAVNDIAREQIRAIERKIASLQALKDELGRLVRQCRRRKVAECLLLGVLSRDDRGHRQRRE